MRVFRIFIFIFGLVILYAAERAIHGSVDLNREQLFVWISIAVMYLMAFGPVTILRTLPSTKNFSKNISVLTAYWYATVAYCAASIVLIELTINRSLILNRGLSDWAGMAKALPVHSGDFISGFIENHRAFAQVSASDDRFFYFFVIAQMILFLLYCIVIYQGCLVRKQIENVAAQETLEMSRIESLRKESELLRQESSRWVRNVEILEKIAQVQEDFRFLSPVNLAEGFDYEAKMLKIVQTLRVVCRQGDQAGSRIESLLEDLQELFLARKMIYKN